MPIYEYRCEKGHTFEVFQSMSDDPVEICEECGAPVQRVLHPVAIHFKGSGFHNTDYKKAGQAGKAGKDGDGASGGESKPDSGDGSKPDSGDGSKPDSGDKKKDSGTADRAAASD